MKKNIVIISGYEQFGYHTDTYNYCMYLKDKYNITFVSADCNLPRINLEGIAVKYIKYSKMRAIRGINKILYPLIISLLKNVDLIFITHFEGCALLKLLLPNKKMILDIRTTEISRDVTRRQRLNEKLKKDIMKFEHITVISEGVRDMLGIPKEKSYILPLGAKTLINSNFDLNIFEHGKLSLLYVGTFRDRRIEDTIKAFNRLSEKYEARNLEYKLIGFFDTEEQKEKINRLINENKFRNIEFIGRVPNEKLGKYFIESNIGVSYIPITEYFNYQPPTKTYEYLFNGLYTIATNTVENAKIINHENGIIIEDTEESFYNALEKLYNQYSNIKRSDIIKTVEDYNWKNICDNLGDYMDSILET